MTNSFISATHDVVFKALFVRYPKILKSFICDAVDVFIPEDARLKILNPELIPEEANGKLSRLDIRVKTAKRKFNVEMQATRKGFYPERVLYYWSWLYGQKVKVGYQYDRLQQTYSLNVLGFNFLDCEDYHSSYSIWEDRRRERLTDKLSIHIFELPKVPKELVDGDKKQMWMELIKAKDEKELEMVKKATRNPAILSGVDAVLELNADPDLREKIYQRDQALLDYGNDMSVARGEGFVKGRKKGRNEGKLARENEIVENMRKSGFTDEQIRLALGSV